MGARSKRVCDGQTDQTDDRTEGKGTQEGICKGRQESKKAEETSRKAPAQDQSKTAESKVRATGREIRCEEVGFKTTKKTDPTKGTAA